MRPKGPWQRLTTAVGYYRYTHIPPPSGSIAALVGLPDLISPREVCMIVAVEWPIPAGGVPDPQPT